MSNIDSIKANRCLVPGYIINLYNALNNNQKLSDIPITFDGSTVPANASDLTINDPINAISIIGSYNSGNPYIKLIGISTEDINVYADGVWNTELTYTLPSNFNYTIVDGIDEQSVLSESIILTIPEKEETICSLASKINTVDTGIGSNLWIDSNIGSDFNDGTTKTNAFQTLGKTLEVLNSNNTGDHVITVHIAPGNYSNDSNSINSMVRVEFIGDVHQDGDEVNININTPLIFQNSDNLVFRELRFTNNTDNINYNGINLVLFDSDNFEISQCNFYHKGSGFDLNNVGLLSLLNSNGLVANTEFSYENVQTNPDIGAGAVRVSNNSFFSWNNWNVTCNNLQHLIINNEGWAYFNKEILTNNNAVPSVPKNTIGWYNNAIESSDKTVTDIIYGVQPDTAESESNPTTLYLYDEEE